MADDNVAAPVADPHVYDYASTDDAEAANAKNTAAWLKDQKADSKSK